MSRFNSLSERNRAFQEGAGEAFEDSAATNEALVLGQASLLGVGGEDVGVGEWAVTLNELAKWGTDHKIRRWNKKRWQIVGIFSIPVKAF